MSVSFFTLPSLDLFSSLRSPPAGTWPHVEHHSYIASPFHRFPYSTCIITPRTRTPLRRPRMRDIPNPSIHGYPNAFSRFASTNCSPPPPMSFFPPNTQRSSAPRSLMANAFSIPIRIRRRPPLFTVPTHVRCWICAVSPFAARTQRTREEAVKKEEPSTPRGGDGFGQHGQPIFVLGRRGTNEE